MSSFFRKAQRKRKKAFLVNGSTLLEEIIVSFNDKHNIPIRSFTAKGLFQATNGFKNWFHENASGPMYKGSFEQHPIVVLYDQHKTSTSFASVAIHNMVITAQMSHHKNVLKLLGCCLEYEVPALVYEYSGTQVLSRMLYYNKERDGTDSGLSWKRRLKIANDIANVLVYLHTAFPTPIVHRDIQANNVIIDKYGVAKLFDFSLCISLPPGESQVEDKVVGCMEIVENEYAMTGVVTTKIDTFYFGLLLLQLLTGRKLFYECYVKVRLDSVKLHEILDPTISGNGGGGAEQDRQVEAVLALVLKCFQDQRNHRPEMIDVAKELKKIDRSIHPS